MEKVIEISLLLDFYGQLLTDRQYEILDLHYNDDYSLAEIAEQLDISRQGVYDNIRRGKALLCEYEKKLGLVGKFAEQRLKTEETLKIINTIENSDMDTEAVQKLREVKRRLREMLDAY